MNDYYLHQTDATTDRDELNDFFSPDSHLNINFLRNKFELLKPFMYNAFDIFLVLETKIDSSFPNSKRGLARYRMSRHGRDSSGGILSM